MAGTIEADYAEMMRDTVLVYARISSNEYGKRAYSSTALAITGRLGNSRRGRTSSDGRVNLGVGTLWCYGTYSVSEDDKAVLPNGDEVEIVSVTHAPDELGQHHTTITFGDPISGRVS